MDYDACREALERAEADLMPAEFHGTVCAMLCTGHHGTIEDWLDEIVVTEVGLGAHARALTAAGDQTRLAFEDDGLALQLMLPADDTPLSHRSQALVDWCAGFLFGLGLAGEAASRRLSSEAREVVTDLIEFSRLDPGDEEDEASEVAYAEIVEYVRMGIVLIYEELAHGGAAGSNRVH